MQNKSLRLIIMVVALLVVGGIVWATMRDNSPSTTNEEQNITDDNSNEDEVDQNDQEPVTEDNSDKQPENIPASLTLDVPFTSQAPLGEWSDIEQQDGCEEASMLMAWHWAQGTTFASAQAALKEIKDYNKFENDNYGNSLDTSAEDTLTIFKDYFDYNKARLFRNPTSDDIVKEIAKGNVVVAPFNGQALNNPNFTGDGPERHMLLIKGYNNNTKEFITNDPGTRNGRSYKYSYSTIMNAMRDYETGLQVPIKGNEKVMIVIEK